MSSIFGRLLGREVKSARQAKERMKLVLIHDRTDLTSDTLDRIKDELIGVISKHVDIDVERMQVEMREEGRSQRLIANIPILTIRRRRLG